MAHRKENGGKGLLAPLPRHLVRQIEKLTRDQRAALRDARLAVVAGELDPEAAVLRLVREYEVTLPLALHVFPEGAR